MLLHSKGKQQDWGGLAGSVSTYYRLGETLNINSDSLMAAADVSLCCA